MSLEAVVITLVILGLVAIFFPQRKTFAQQYSAIRYTVDNAPNWDDKQRAESKLLQATDDAENLKSKARTQEERLKA